MSIEEAERIIEDEIRKLPPLIRKKINNVGIFIEEKTIRSGVLGLYRGIPYNKRGIFYSALPDRIVIYLREIEKYGKGREEETLRKVLLHEIGHYFGLSDYQMRKIGY